jgi:hypothetical protein
MLYGQLNPPSDCPLLILAQSNFLLLLLGVLMFVPIHLVIRVLAD